MQRILALLLPLIFVLSGCYFTEEYVALPDSTLLRGIEVDNSQILYQYHGKFATRCIHHRALIRAEATLDTKGWKSLPISNSDLSLINDMPNKLDKLAPNILKVPYYYKANVDHTMISSSDISLSSNWPKTIPLQNGYYKLIYEGYLIYFPQEKLLYHEVHDCRD